MVLSLKLPYELQVETGPESPLAVRIFQEAMKNLLSGVSNLASQEASGWWFRLQGYLDSLGDPLAVLAVMALLLQ